MKKQIAKSALVLTLIAIVCGVLLTLVNSVTSPVIEKAKKQKIVDTCKVIFPTLVDTKELETSKIGNPLITQVYTGLDSSKKEVGYIFIGGEKNKFGTIELIVGITLDGSIQDVDFITLEQTLNLETTRKNAKKYVGKDVSNLDVVITGTGVSYSFASIDAIVRASVKVFNSNFEVAVPKLLFSDIFGETYESSELITTPVENSKNSTVDGTALITTSKVSSDLVISGGTKSGHILTIEGKNNTGFSSSTSTIKIATDENYKVLGYKVVSLDATEDPFPVTQFDQLIGLDLHDLSLVFSAAGVSYTLAVVNQLLITTATYVASI
jgi:Na+-translocating ferredoxin:NAD+ oxidoreductase RnfG subunit